MKTLAGLAVLAVLSLCVQAQDNPAPQPVDLGVYGGSGHEAAASLAEGLGARLMLHDIEADSLPAETWAVRKQATPQQAAELLGHALGCQALFDARGKTLHLYQPGVSLRGSKVKGYDVSVLAGRFVEYVNKHGAPRKPAKPGDEAEPELTASEHLSILLEELLYDPRGANAEPSVVGDRLLYTTDDATHARVREALDLLMAEHGGESAALKAEREAVEKLKNTRFSAEMTGTPVSSILTEICATAGLGVVLGPGLADFACAEHIDFKPREGSAWEALHGLLVRLRANEISVDFKAAAGALVFELEDEHQGSGYRVYDIAELLKKLETSYQRQRTAPGKDEGFDGDLRGAGGNQVILDSLDEQLEAAHAPGRYSCEAYGTRLVVRGGNAAVNAATQILKEMGWEEPGK